MLAKAILLTVLLSIPVVLAAGPAIAGPGKNKGGNGGYQTNKYEWRTGDCRYRFKQGKHGFKAGQKCKGGARYWGGPPPWAPAHGYRAQQGGGYRAAYVPPFDIGLGRCNREMLGGLLGAAVGGLAGSKIGDGKGQLAAVAGGTLLGFLIGGTIGRGMDEIDQNCVGQILEHARDGQQIVWNNPQAGNQYQVVPTQTVQDSDGRYCREYTTTSIINGKNQQTYGRACRQPDGSWQIVQ